MGGGRNVTVVLIDDHEIQRRGMLSVLAAAPGIDVVGTATSLLAGQVLLESGPDVAVVDAHVFHASDPTVRAGVRDVGAGTRWVLLEDEHRGPALTPIAVHEVLRISKHAAADDLVATVRAAAAARIEPSRTGREDFPQLSDAEWRVLELLGQGLSNREMATQLHVAEQTVKNYVSVVLRKLGVDSRAKAAVLVGGSLTLYLGANADGRVPADAPRPG